MPPFRPPASTPCSSVLTKSAMPYGRFSAKANSAPSRLELRVIQTTRRSALGCGIAGDHRLHFASRPVDRPSATHGYPPRAPLPTPPMRPDLSRRSQCPRIAKGHHPLPVLIPQREAHAGEAVPEIEPANLPQRGMIPQDLRKPIER